MLPEKERKKETKMSYFLEMFANKEIKKKQVTVKFAI